MTQCDCAGERMVETYNRPNFQSLPGEPCGVRETRYDAAVMAMIAEESGIPFVGGDTWPRCEEPGEWVWEQDFVDAPDCDEDCED